MVSVLQAKTSETVRHTAKISPEVASALTMLQERLRSEAPTLQLDTDTIVEKALSSAIKKANKELDAEQKGQITSDHTISGD